MDFCQGKCFFPAVWDVLIANSGCFHPEKAKLCSQATQPTNLLFAVCELYRDFCEGNAFPLPFGIFPSQKFQVTSPREHQIWPSLLLHYLHLVDIVKSFAIRHRFSPRESQMCPRPTTSLFTFSGHCTIICNLALPQKARCGLTYYFIIYIQCTVQIFAIQCRFSPTESQMWSDLLLHYLHLVHFVQICAIQHRFSPTESQIWPDLLLHYLHLVHFVQIFAIQHCFFPQRKPDRRVFLLTIYSWKTLYRFLPKQCFSTAMGAWMWTYEWKSQAGHMRVHKRWYVQLCHQLSSALETMAYHMHVGPPVVVFLLVFFFIWGITWSLEEWKNMQTNKNRPLRAKAMQWL